MNKPLVAAIGALLFAGSTFGFEHKLQFTPYIPYNPLWGNSLVVIGEQFTKDASGQIDGVTGLIHFVTVPSGCRYICPHTNHDWTGLWDLQGNLLGTVDTPWAAQPAIGSAVSTTPVPGIAETVYAKDVLGNGNAVTTGRDAYGRGYVDSVQSHYTWSQATIPVETTPGYMYIPRTPPTQIVLSVTSDGDLALDVASTVFQVVASGSYTNGTGTAAYTPQPGDCLSGPVSPAATCSIEFTFDPSTIVSSGSPYGYAYNILTLTLVSDAGDLAGFTIRFTISGFTPPDE